MVADDGQWERALSSLLSWCYPVAGSVDGACGEEHRVHSETRDEESEHNNTNSTASLDAGVTRGCSSSKLRLTETEQNGPTGRSRTEHLQAAVSTRMVVLMEHAPGEREPLDLPTAPSDSQLHAQLCCVPAMLMKGGALTKARNALVGHGSDIWTLCGGEVLVIGPHLLGESAQGY